MLLARETGVYLSANQSMIAWCFSYDKINYARYLSAYFAEITNLPEKNPCVYEAFKAGQFSVQMSSNNLFGRIPVDQTTEVTVNKDTHTPGGTARFSLKAGTIKRYYITAKPHKRHGAGQKIWTPPCRATADKNNEG